MQLVVLTTDTLHHARFIKEVSAHYPIAEVFAETSSTPPPFETQHSFEDLRDAYESEIWFSGEHVSVSDIMPCHRFRNINDPEAVKALQESAADVVVIFGTSRLTATTIAAAGKTVINLHGGDPEAYRGLDTHLWAIYHGDFANLITTIHRVNPTLDDGEIISSLPVALSQGMKLHQLRAANTEVCTRLTLAALDQFNENNEIVSRPQRTKGRYYSFMPAALKELSVNKFHRYTETIK